MIEEYWRGRKGRRARSGWVKPWWDSEIDGEISIEWSIQNERTFTKRLWQTALKTGKWATKHHPFLQSTIMIAGSYCSLACTCTTCKPTSITSLDWELCLIPTHYHVGKNPRDDDPARVCSVDVEYSLLSPKLCGGWEDKCRWSRFVSLKIRISLSIAVQFWIRTKPQ